MFNGANSLSASPQQADVLTPKVINFALRFAVLNAGVTELHHCNTDYKQYQKQEFDEKENLNDQNFKQQPL